MCKVTTLLFWLAPAFCKVLALSVLHGPPWHAAPGTNVPWSCLSMTEDNRIIESTELVEELSFSAVYSDASLGDLSLLLHFQENAAPIATSFLPSTYRPHPILTNTHLQTIGGVFFRDLEDCAYVSNVAVTAKSVVQRVLTLQRQQPQPHNDNEWFWDYRQQIHTPDGDFYHVDYKYTTNEENKGTIVLLHGLQSNSNSSLSIDLAKAYHHQLGMNVACMNFRGCSGEPNDKIGEISGIKRRIFTTLFCT